MLLQFDNFDTSKSNYSQKRNQGFKQVSRQLAFNNAFVVIKNQWDLKACRRNKNHKERISVAVPDWSKINCTYLRWSETKKIENFDS